MSAVDVISSGRSDRDIREDAEALQIRRMHPADLLVRGERDEAVIRRAHGRYPARKQAAERLCEAINDMLGWRGADPHFCRVHGYSGGVTLSQRAAVELTTMALLHATGLWL
jgi:hypothetical protein